MIQTFQIFTLICLFAFTACAPKENQDTNTQKSTKTQHRKPAVENQAAAQVIFSSAPVPGEKLNVSFSGELEENDWVSIVPEAKTDLPWGEQHYFNGWRKTAVAMPKEPGKYLAKLYRQRSDAPELLATKAFEIEGKKGEQIVDSWKINVYQDLSYVSDRHAPLSWGQSSVVTDIQALEPDLKLPKLPEGSAKPTFGYFRLGNGPDRKISFLVSNDQLYLDRNNNEDLSDDGEPYGSGAAEPEITLELQNEQGQSYQQAYSFRYFFNAYHNGYKMYTRSFYEGELNFKGHKVKALAFESQNHNGLMRDDGIWLDLNKNGTFEENEHYFHFDRIYMAPNYFQLELTSP